MFDRQRVLNILAIGTSLLVFALFQLGVVSEADTFLIVSSIAIFYTGRQLSQREGQPVGEALVEMLTKPSAYPRKAAYAAYIGCVGIGALVAAQALVA